MLLRRAPLRLAAVTALVLAVGAAVWLLRPTHDHGAQQQPVAAPAAAAPPKPATHRPLGRLRQARSLATVRPPPRLALRDVLPRRTVDVPILMFHRIDVLRPDLAALTRRLTVAPDGFAADMRWLWLHHYHPLRQVQLFNALEHGARLPPHPILITFDDGYRDVLGRASPILERYHFPATAYVITDRISGSDPSFLTWGNLAALEQRGVEIGSHTVHHLDLTTLGGRQAWSELSRSRRVLEQHLHHPVQWLSYPDGREDARIVALARRAGYVLAVTTRPGRLQRAGDPLELRRIEILDTTGVRGLAAQLGARAST